MVLYLLLVKLCAQCDFLAISQKFYTVSVGVGMVSITTFKVKFKCHKSQVFCFLVIQILSQCKIGQRNEKAFPHT